MTRKKSNVKALALAVTCAILAGGYSGLNPVYAAVNLYKDSVTGDVTTKASQEINGNTQDNHQIFEITSGLTIGEVEIGKTTGVISTKNLKLDGVDLSETLKTLNDNLTTQKNNYTSISVVLNTENKTLTGMESVSAKIIEATETLKVGEQEVTAEKVKGYDAAVVNTGGITRDQKGLGLSYDRTTIEGLSIASDESTVGLYIGDWNESVGAKNAAIKISRGSDNISEVTIPRLYVSEIKDSSSPSTEAITFADIKGAVKATDKISYDDTNGTVVDGKLSLKNSDGSYSSVNDTVENTKNISIVQDKYVTSSDATKIDGITVAGGVRLADGNVRGKSLVLEGVVASGKPPQKTLTYDRLSAFTGLLVENGNEPAERDNDNKTVIDAGDGSKIGGVTFTNKSSDPNQKYVDVNNVGSINEDQIKFGQDTGFHDTTTINKTMEISERFGSDSYGSVKINEGRDNQVIIGEEGIVVGKNSTVIGSDGVYAGGHTEATAKAVLNADGSIKGAGDGAGNYKFTVDDVTGNVTTDGDIQGKDITATGALKSASLEVTGNATVGGTLNSKGKFSVGDAEQFTVDAATGNVVSKGKITSASAQIGAVEIANDGTITGVKAITTDTLTVTNGFSTNGNIQSASLNVTGNATIGGTLGVTGAVTGASFNGANITSTTFNGATIDATHFNDVILSGGNVTATGIIGTTITGTTVTDGAGASMNAGTVKGTTITDGVASMNQGNLTGVKDITATGNVKTSGTVQGTTLTDGVASMNGGKVTAQNGLVVDANNQLTNAGLKTSDINATKAQIGNISIDGAVISSNTGTGLTIEGVNINNKALSSVDSIDGVSVGAVTGGNGLQFGDNAVIGATNKPFSSIGFEVDGEGNVKGKSFKVNDSNYLDSTGLTAESATIGGVNNLDSNGIDTNGKLHVGGQATFGDGTGTHTTINGGTITSTNGTDSTIIGPGTIKTKTLDVDVINLGDKIYDANGGTYGSNLSMDSKGNIVAAGGKFIVAGTDKTNPGKLTNIVGDTAHKYTSLGTDVDGAGMGHITATNDAYTVRAEKDKAKLSAGTITDRTNGTIKDKASVEVTNNDDGTATITGGTSSIVVKSESITDTVGTATRTLKENEIVDEVAGKTITTDTNGTKFGITGSTDNTLINGSSITSTNGSATGVLNGSNLTLTKDADNKTELTAGGATFTGAAGEKGGKTTTINGGTISTDTLNVERINLGGEVIDKGAAGIEDNSKLYMDAQGNFRAASGKFKVSGADGAMTNTVGDTTLKTTADGATISNGNASIDVKKDSITDKVGNTTVETKDGSFSVKGNTGNGMDIDTSTGKTTFTGTVDSTVATDKTTIDGNTIKTGHLITDKLTITGKGNAGNENPGTDPDTGNITLAGDGSIESSIVDRTNNKETNFKTDIDGTHTMVEDANTKTNFDVKASGTTTTVQDKVNTDNSSNSYQTSTSIGGVVTNGKVSMKQELTTDGLKISDEKGDAANYTQITDKDVSIADQKNAGKRINLSDLGQLGDLNEEITSRDEYKQNSTAVGAINSVSGRLTDEVNRLDGRINDVSDRVNKVGAMAAAIASLKSIGYDPQAPSEFSIGLGQYKGETGVAMGFFHYPNKNFMINVSLSTAGGETMGGIGATWRFGHKSPQKLLDEQREAQAKKELAAAEKYQAAAKLAKEAQERAEYAAKLARQAQVSADNAKAAADATQAKHF